MRESRERSGGSQSSPSRAPSVPAFVAGLVENGTSTTERVPPDVLARLRVAAPQLDLRQGDITTAALDAFLSEQGF